MTSRIRASRIFLSAITLLCICGVATYLSFAYFRASERWVIHAQEVRGALGDLESTVNVAGRSRLLFLTSGSNAELSAYRQATTQIAEKMRHLRGLVLDNASQVANCDHLELVTNERLREWDASVQAKTAGVKLDLDQLLEKTLGLSSQSGAIADAIRGEEAQLIVQRTLSAHRHFLFATAAVIISFVLAILLLYLNYRVLNRELYAREEAEKRIRSAYEEEATMRREQDRFRLFVDAVQDYAIYLLDPGGHIASWNRGAQRIKGYSASEIIGQHFSVFFTEQDRLEGHPLRELQIAEQDGQFRGEGWRMRKDGSRFWASIVLTAIKDNHGKLAGFAKVTRDFTERMQAQEKLERANAELQGEAKERLLAQERLAESESSLRALSLHLLKTQDEERRRIGRELHDSLGQYLAMLKMNLDSLDTEILTKGGAGREPVARCIQLVEESIKEMRTISYLLYPPMLEEVGLKSAIPWYLEGFSKRSNIKTTFKSDPEFGRLGRGVELALFRVLQESLTNVHRHSGSDTAEVRLSRRDGIAILEVADKGKGISPTLMEQSSMDWLGSLGVGLRGMNERIRQLGGKLDISSSEGGTVVTAGVPVVEQVSGLGSPDGQFVTSNN